MAAAPGAGGLRARLMRWLARRDRSEREIRERLATWGGEAEEIESIVTEFEERGLIDDTTLADKICDWHRRRDPLGPRRLRARLQSRGIASDLAEAAAAPHGDEEVQRDLIAQIKLKRLPAIFNLAPVKRRQRLRDHLLRRGFDPWLVDDATRELSREDATLEDFQ